MWISGPCITREISRLPNTRLTVSRGQGWFKCNYYSQLCRWKLLKWLLSAESSQCVTPHHILISFEHRPRRLDNVQKDIANIAQKVADMAAEEALVGSLGCITKGVIRASSESFPHFPHFPLGLWSSWHGRIWMHQALWTRQVVLQSGIVMILSRLSAKRANWKHWTKGFRRSSVLSRTESEDGTGHDGTEFKLFWARHARLHMLHRLHSDW
jgi:hypothetical protein